VLKTHGIQIEYLKESTTLEVEGYQFESIQPSQRLFQGHYPNNIKGSAVSEVKTFQEGTMVIRTAQPLGSLIAYLLEPLSDDGLLKWNFFDNYLVSQWGGRYYPYPVYKIFYTNEIETIAIE